MTVIVLGGGTRNFTGRNGCCLSVLLDLIHVFREAKSHELGGNNGAAQVTDTGVFRLIAGLGGS
ncbi:MAG: hypothetical protein KUG79_08635 [Pseudomonadales bacterium]|nr:hypothetical protein [Pseudomonadales bacterium]